MPGEVEYKTFGIYPVIGTQTAATGSWTGIIDVPQLYDGLTIAYYLPYAGDGNASLNLTLSDGSTTGAVACYYTNTSRMTTHYGAGSVIILTYFSAGSISVAGTNTAEARWLRCDYNTNTVPAAYCSTAAGTAAKAATCSGYSLLANSYLHIVMTASNTSASALTLNVNSKGAKPIYINGTASSATNYTLPAGSYLIYYNGTNYYFRTDGYIPYPNTIGSSTKPIFLNNGVPTAFNSTVGSTTQPVYLNNGVLTAAASPMVTKIVKTSSFGTISWTADSTYTDFPYHCDITVTGVTANHYAEVVFDVVDATSGLYAPICSTAANKVRIFASKNTARPTIKTIIAFI